MCEYTRLSARNFSVLAAMQGSHGQSIPELASPKQSGINLSTPICPRISA